MWDTIESAWREYLSTDDLPRGDDLYEGIFQRAQTLALQRKDEIRGMMRVARTIRPKVVMEIGTDRGGSFYNWIKCQDTVERAIASELRGVPFAEPFREHFPNVDILAISGSSYAPEQVASVSSWLGNDTIDCLFIDGDKSGFDKDFDAYLPLLSDPAIVFMHDINGDGAFVRVFERLSKKYPSGRIIDTSECVPEMVRVKCGTPPESDYHAWMRHWLKTSCGVGILWVSHQDP